VAAGNEQIGWVCLDGSQKSNKNGGKSKKNKILK
jgi:hypothetical protein